MPIIVALALNFVISWMNCWSVGGIWAESKALGGSVRLLAWCAAIQAAIGFSSVLGFLVGAVAYHLHFLSPRAADAAESLWYLLIIVPAVGTGLIITIESWIAAYRERSLLNMGTAVWNTYAQLHNIAGAIDGVGEAFSNVFSFFSSEDEEEGGLGALVIGLVVVALAGGVALTVVLISYYSGRLPVPARPKQPVASA
jgi:hypothetical protein